MIKFQGINDYLYQTNFVDLLPIKIYKNFRYSFINTLYINKFNNKCLTLYKIEKKIDFILST